MRFILSVALCLAFASAAAQAPEARNLATDTLQPANAKYHYRVSRLGTVSGQTLYVFITGLSGRGNGVEFTWRNPFSLPRPKPVLITSEQIQWVRLGEEIQYTYWEPLRLPGQKARDLVPCILTGPRIAVFDEATPKKGVPIPLPVGGVFWTGTFSNNYNHIWYLRRAGERTMTQVPTGKKFAPFLADYLADAPTLAADIRARAAGSCYTDVPALLAAYNQASSPAKL